MSDNAARNTPDGDRPESGDWGVEPPADLDAALAQAADMADSLSDQVGLKEAHSADDTLVSNAQQIEAGAAGVDEQLNEIERMIGEVQSEVGSEAGAPVESVAVAGAAASSSTASRSSATAPASVAPPGDTANPQAARATKGGGSGATPPGAAANHATAAQPDAQKSPRGPGGLRRMIGAGVNAGYGALDIIDRPFGFVGPRVRGILGWVAIALFAAGVIVLVVTRQ